MKIDLNNRNEPSLLFTCQMDDRLAREIEQKGWFECAVASLPGGIEVPLSFWDPVRLSQESEAAAKSGRPCFAEPGMIVIPQVTVDYMERAIKQLYTDGYFGRLLSLSKGKSEPA